MLDEKRDLDCTLNYYHSILFGNLENRLLFCVSSLSNLFFKSRKGVESLVAVSILSTVIWRSMYKTFQFLNRNA